MSRKNPKPQRAWGWYNYGALIGIKRTRKAAIEAVEAHTMRPWKEAREYMEVSKVMVVPQ